MIKHRCGEYCFRTVLFDSERDMKLRLALGNQYVVLKKPEYVFQYYVIVCDRQSDEHSIGIGFYSSVSGNSPTIETDPSGRMYISNGVTLSFVDLKKPAILFEYQTSSLLYLYKVFSKTILLVEKHHIELISFEGKRIKQMPIKGILEYYRFWDSFLWYKTDLSEGKIDLDEFGVE